MKKQTIAWNKASEMIYMRALTPIHAGAGSSVIGVDMPIQREAHSGIPKIEASGVKGSVKSFVYRSLENSDQERELFDRAFGADQGNAGASELCFTDAKLLFFPVRALKGVYALVTCPYVLARWIREQEADEKERERLQEKESVLKNLSLQDSGEVIAVSEKYLLKGKGESFKAVLEEYVFSVKKVSQELERLFDKELIDEEVRDRILILSDEDFIDLVTMHTEVITRNKIDLETGVAEQGGLFTEEYLPAESILYFSVIDMGNYGEGNDKNRSIDYFKDRMPSVWQIGGDKTLGKGIVERIWEIEPKESSEEANDGQQN